MTVRLRHFGVVLCLLLAGLVSRLPTAQAKTTPVEVTDLVTYEPGDLPIILTAPHGGRDPVPGVVERRGEGVERFNPRSDSNTDLLAERLAVAIQKKIGRRPFVIIARFHRKYVDGNRPHRDAYESEEGRVIYDGYHQAIARACELVSNRWGRGIVIDIHGQGIEPNSILRGTQNGKTTAHLVRRFGREALIGETSLFGQLASQGFAVMPAVGSEDREHAKYDGGYTVITHGSGSGGMLDAIQLEFGNDLRSHDAMPATVSKLTDAVIAFANRYLPKADRPSQRDGDHPRSPAVRSKGKG